MAMLLQHSLMRARRRLRLIVINTRIAATAKEPLHRSRQGSRPLPVMERMLRIYFMQNRYFVQNWFNLSDPGAEDAPDESESMRRFAGIELAEDTIPDE